MSPEAPRCAFVILSDGVSRDRCTAPVVSHDLLSDRAQEVRAAPTSMKRPRRYSTAPCMSEELMGRPDPPPFVRTPEEPSAQGFPAVDAEPVSFHVRRSTARALDFLGRCGLLGGRFLGRRGRLGGWCGYNRLFFRNIRRFGSGNDRFGGDDGFFGRRFRRGSGCGGFCRLGACGCRCRRGYRGDGPLRRGRYV